MFDLTTIRKLADELLRIEAEELIAQGHRSTGKLINTLSNPVKPIPGGFVIEGQMEEYGLALEKKRQPGKPPPISALMSWIRTKGIASTNKQVRSIAFAIQRAILLEGIPTTGRRTPNGRGSFRFSKVGRRTAWITQTLKQAEPLFDKTVDDIADKQAELIIDNIIRNFKK